MSSKQDSCNALSGRHRKYETTQKYPSSGHASSGSGGMDDELVGMYIGGWASAPVKVSPKADTKYNVDLLKADNVPGLDDAREDVIRGKQEVYKTSGWFSCDAACQSAKRRLNTAVEKLKPLEDKRYAIIKAAKHEVGVWSKYGVDETREKFWETFQDGKDFAKRMTFWDMMFSIGRRDENGGAFIAKWVLRILMNYTMGMVYTLVSFMFQLYGIVSSYTPNFASGVVFYLVAVFSRSEHHRCLLVFAVCHMHRSFYMLAKNARPVNRQGETPMDRGHGYNTHRNNSITEDSNSQTNHDKILVIWIKLLLHVCMLFRVDKTRFVEESCMLKHFGSLTNSYGE